MSAITVIRGPAPYLDRANVDTDSIIRLDRQREFARDALGPFALEALRFDALGNEVPGFVLNDDRFRHAPFLLAGANFGCGSSREGAVWALKAYGIRCIVAPSFGDIFLGNCFQNAVLPIAMDKGRIDILAGYCASGEEVELDLEHQRLAVGGQAWRFEIDPLNKRVLLNGTDSITETQTMTTQIQDWESAYRVRRPWVVVTRREPPVSAAPVDTASAGSDIDDRAKDR